MKIFLVLILVLSSSIAFAADKIYLMKMPEGITAIQANQALKKAAIRRKWTASVSDNNQVQVKLDHHGYNAKLIFSISNGEVYYKDLTTTEEADEFSDVEAGGFTPVPSHWLNNIKNDATVFMNRMDRRGANQANFSAENIEAKLESLKKMYDKQLITESEYKQKKQELLSKY